MWPATWSRLCTFSRPRPCPAAAIRLCAKERSTDLSRSLKASLATPDNSRVRLLVTARRAAPSLPARKTFLLGLGIRVFQGASSSAFKLSSPCRSHIRPGLRPSVPRPPPRDSPWQAASVFSSVVRPRRPAPPPRRVQDRDRVSRACWDLDGSCRPFILAILASPVALQTQSWFESFLPLRLRSRRARSSAVGVSRPRSVKRSRSGEGLRRPAQALGGRTHHRLAQPLPPTGQGLGEPQPQRARLHQARVHSTHAPKTL